MSHLSQEYEPESGVLPEEGREVGGTMDSWDEGAAGGGGGSIGREGTARLAELAEAAHLEGDDDSSYDYLSCAEGDVEMGSSGSDWEDDIREAYAPRTASPSVLLSGGGEEERFSSRFSEPQRSARGLAGGRDIRRPTGRRLGLLGGGGTEERPYVFGEVRREHGSDESAARGSIRELATSDGPTFFGSVGRGRTTTGWGEETEDDESVRTEEPTPKRARGFRDW